MNKGKKEEGICERNENFAYLLGSTFLLSEDDVYGFYYSGLQMLLFSAAHQILNAQSACV